MNLGQPQEDEDEDKQVETLLDLQEPDTKDVGSEEMEQDTRDLDNVPSEPDMKDIRSKEMEQDTGDLNNAPSESNELVGPKDR
jgi:hypothetical protein